VTRTKKVVIASMGAAAAGAAIALKTERTMIQKPEQEAYAILSFLVVYLLPVRSIEWDGFEGRETKSERNCA
jgi:hypothetical protein